jgi:hypothetical protein
MSHKITNAVAKLKTFVDPLNLAPKVLPALGKASDPLNLAPKAGKMVTNPKVQDTSMGLAITGINPLFGAAFVAGKYLNQHVKQPLIFLDF